MLASDTSCHEVIESGKGGDERKRVRKDGREEGQSIIIRHLRMRRGSGEEQEGVAREDTGQKK